MGNVAVYKKGTTDFFSQGLGLLSDVVSSNLTQTASSTGNVEQKLEVEYPIDGYLVSELVEGAILRVSVSTDKSDYGVFEIVDTLKDDSGTITVYGDPYYNRILRMSFDNGGVFTKFSSVQSALNAAKQNITGFPTNFNLISNLSTSVDLSANTYDTFGTFLEALNSAVHGNIKYSLNSIQIYSALGKDITDITLRDDMNTSSVKITTDFSGIINKVIPVLPVLDKDGNATDKTKVGTIVTSKYSNQFLDYWAGKVIQFDTQDLANTYFDRTNADRPVQTVDVDPIGLDDDFSTINIFDTIELYSTRLDYTDKLRVSERVFDTLSENVTSFKLGSSSVNIFNQINEQNNEIFNNVVKLTNAAISANGKGIDYFGQAQPSSPKEGDTWFWDDGTDFGIKQYTNGEWVDLAGSKTAEKIAASVTEAVTQAKAHTDEVKQVLSTDIDTAKSQATSQASTAEANAKSAATSQFTQAQSALSAAKSDLTNSIASEASARNQAVATANSQAQTYANQAKSDAMSAASTADGVIRTAISSSADSLSATITQNQSSADSGISTAQTTAKAALDGLEFKVSKTDYDQKTGDLSTKINDVKQTADSSAQTIADIKIADGKQDARMSEIENTASGLKSTVSDLQTTQGKQSGDISTLQQRAEGFEATVTKVNNLAVGGRNLLLGTRDWTDNTKWNQRNTVTTETYRGMVIASSGRAWSSPFYLIQNAGILQVGKTYTFSTYVRNTSDTDTKVTSYYDSGIVTPNAYTIPLPAHTDWIRVSTTLKVIKDPTTSTLGLRWEGENGLTNGFIQFAGYKLEEGNLPTDWTPAPEDLSSATAKAQLTADNAALAVGKLTSADGVITKAQADIKANADAITQKVSKTDYDKKTGELSGYISTLKQRADGFDATVTKVNNFSVGGRNYVLNTNVSTTSNITGFYSSVPSSYFNNKKLTLSVQLDYDNITALSGQQRLGVEFVILNKDGSNRYIGSWKYPAIGDSFHGRIYTTFDFSNNEFKDYATNQMANGIYVQGVTGTNVSVSKPKLEIGTSGTDWTPAPEDTTTALAQVKITADSISNFVRDSSGNISSDFQTALSRTSIITGSTLATSIKTQTSSQITSALTDNNGKIISLINQDSSGVQIAGKNLAITADTTVDGNFWAKQVNAIQVNASNITTGTLNASNVNIINLNVNSLTGNVSNFIQSNWNGEYSSTKISSTGMQIGGFTANGFDTIFDKTGITFETTDARYGYAIAHYGTDAIKNSSGTVMARGMEIRTGNENGIGFDYFAIKSPGANNLELGKTTNAGHVSIAVVPDTNLMPIFNKGVTILDDLYVGKVNGAKAGGLFSVLAGRTIHIPTSMNNNGTVGGWLDITL